MVTVLQWAVLLAHKHVPSSEEVLFILDLGVKIVGWEQHKKYLSPVARVNVLCYIKVFCWFSKYSGLKSYL